jgi:hypothetical protein
MQRVKANAASREPSEARLPGLGGELDPHPATATIRAACAITILAVIGDTCTDALVTAACHAV